MAYFTRLERLTRDIMSSTLGNDQKLAALDALIRSVHGQAEQEAISMLLQRAKAEEPYATFAPALTIKEMFNPTGLKPKMLVESAKADYLGAMEFMLDAAVELNTLLAGTGIEWDGAGVTQKSAADDLKYTEDQLHLYRATEQ